MAYDVSIAVYAVNKYVWSLMQEYMDWDAADYGQIPIVPSNQEDKLLATNRPFMVYGWGFESGGVLMTTEQVAYSIYSNASDAVSEINDILKLLYDAFKRGDRTADDINTVTPGVGMKHVEVTGFSGPEAEQESGGRRAGLILIRYTYGQDNPFETV